MKITLDISPEYARVLLDQVIEDAACCDDHEREELEAVADTLHSALKMRSPRPSLLKTEPKPF